MKFTLKASVAAAVFALASGAQAATITNDIGGVNNGADVLVNILNQDTGDSLLVNTRLNSYDLANSIVTDYTSSTALTADISAFLGGTTNAKFYAIGEIRNSFGTDISSLATSSVFFDGKGELGIWATNYSGYINDANIGAFGLDTAGDGPDIENVGTDPKLGFANANFSPFVAGVAVGDSAVWKLTNLTFLGGTTTKELLSWSLATDGTLHYGAAVSSVPVPAAVWLFGSGLVGLVGVARRRTSA